MAKLVAIEPAGSSRTEPGEINQKHNQAVFNRAASPITR
jgi:hypothetical protein